jgi:dTDP-4-dehydrorhamnose reductase
MIATRFLFLTCAAYTIAGDLTKKERDKIYLVNGLGVHKLALAYWKLDILIVHISTDYDFSEK